MRRILLFTALLIITGCMITVHSQPYTVVSDGSPGLTHGFVYDTVYVIEVEKDSPSHRAGIIIGDIVLEVDGQAISGKNLKTWELREILSGTAGDSKELRIFRRSIDSVFLVPLSYQKDETGFQDCHIRYLVDPSGMWTIDSILTATVDSLFKDPIMAKISVDSIYKGGYADRIGMRKGDLIVSLEREIDSYRRENWDWFDRSLDYYYLRYLSKDTAFLVKRGDTILRLSQEEDPDEGFIGIRSEYEKDMEARDIWVKLTIKNTLQQNANYMLIAYPDDSVSLYHSSSLGKIEEKITGRQVLSQDRSMSFNTYFDIIIQSGEIQTYYLHITKQRTHWITIRVAAADYLLRLDRLNRLFTGLLWGMMLIIAFYYLIIYLFVRDRSYIPFSLFIISLVYVLSRDTGYLEEFVSMGINFKWIHRSVLNLIFVSITISLFNLFGIVYLELKKYLKVWRKIIISIIIFLWLNLAFLILLNFGFDLGFESNMYSSFDIIVVITMLVLIVIPIIPTVLRIIKKSRPSWFFLAGTIVLIGLSYYYIDLAPDEGDSATTIASLVVTNLSVEFGAIFQIFLFVIALGKKFRSTRIEKEEAQRQYINQLEENEKLKDKVNRELELKVVERTKEIVEQKEEIESQRDEIESQRDQLVVQRDLLVLQQSQITDSLNYAKRIQQAMLPSTAYISSVLRDHFILFKPRDIVSGDFYWVKEEKNYLVVVAADCTGHGVPGAFMSMLGITLLNELVGKAQFDQAGEVLDILRSKVKETLSQKGTAEEQKDGMDIAMAVVDRKNPQLLFAGAFNPLYLIRHNSNPDKSLDNAYSRESESHILYEFKGDYQPVGIYTHEEKFKTHKIYMQQGDTIYLFSDGFPDQKGGPQGKKYMSKRFKRTLLDLQHLSMEDQHRELEKTLESWQGDREQIDDILVIGVRVGKQPE